MNWYRLSGFSKRQLVAIFIGSMLLACARTCSYNPNPVTPIPDSGSGGSAAAGGLTSTGGTTISPPGSGGSKNTGGTTAAGGLTSSCPVVELPSPPASEIAQARKASQRPKLQPRHYRRHGRAKLARGALPACFPWHSCPTIPLNQIDGSCTGQTGVELLACALSPNVDHYNQTDALQAYQGGTCFDNNCSIPCTCQSCSRAYCPATHANDVGSYGSSVAQWMVDVDWLNGYTAADDLPSLKSGIAKAPCAIGVDFYNSMFDVDPKTGQLKVIKSSSKAGGHDMIGVHYDALLKRFDVRTSWGNVWWCLKSQVNANTPTRGDGCGFGWIAESDMTVLNFDADCAL